MARKRKSRRPSRSKFEQGLMDRLDSQRVEYGYETKTFLLRLASVGHKCQACGSKLIEKDTRYTPDFFFRNWIVEAKGRFTARDRKKVLAMRRQYPMQKFGMLFMRDNALSKNSVTHYSDWCRVNDVPFAIGWFRPEWLK